MTCMICLESFGNEKLSPSMSDIFGCECVVKVHNVCYSSWVKNCNACIICRKGLYSYNNTNEEDHHATYGRFMIMNLTSRIVDLVFNPGNKLVLFLLMGFLIFHVPGSLLGLLMMLPTAGLQMLRVNVGIIVLYNIIEFLGIMYYMFTLSKILFLFGLFYLIYGKCIALVCNVVISFTELGEYRNFRFTF